MYAPSAKIDLEYINPGKSVELKFTFSTNKTANEFYLEVMKKARRGELEINAYIISVDGQTI